MLDGVVGWPPDFAHRYRARGYWAGTTLGQAFDRSAGAHADRVAVVDGARRVTYRELSALVNRLAVHLALRGVRDGARAVFQLPNVLEFVVAYVACLKVGAIPVCCLPAHRHAEIGHLAKFTEAAAWFIPSDFRGFDYVAMAEELRGELPALSEIFVAGERAGSGMSRLGDLLADPVEARTPPGSLGRLRPEPGDVAVFQLSGGTTGLPKVIPRTHDDYFYNSQRFAAVTGLDEASVLLVSVPAAHNFALASPGVQGALLLGARVVLAPSPDPETVFRLVESERVTWVPAVPASVIGWLNHPARAKHDLASIRQVYVGGSRLNPEAARAARAALGPVVHQVFGMAEGLLCATRPDDPLEIALETQGRPMCPDDEIRIVDDDGREVPPGEVGELLCRGPYTIRGYYRAAEHNRTAFTADGFYRTGDLVRRHPSGNLIVEGRKKDTINRGGEKISSEELESLILAHPAVLNVAVVAVPDPVLGERACACVIPKPGRTLTLAELGRFLLDEKRIAKFKLPERLELRDRFPTTPVGKISKKDLREELRGARAT
ncbi:MAG: AMP-binding protein [Candidatus Rokubacteria bacterium]|nr:AMP-binding protein [Candidatus Rokubacteria bacterium]MBI4253689.1 AMP-binding protein [Candidatus Rokubacteria bacterium]